MLVYSAAVHWRNQDYIYSHKILTKLSKFKWKSSFIKLNVKTLTVEPGIDSIIASIQFNINTSNKYISQCVSRYHTVLT